MTTVTVQTSIFVGASTSFAAAFLTQVKGFFKRRSEPKHRRNDFDALNNRERADIGMLPRTDQRDMSRSCFW